MSARTTNVLLVGVGGQGVLLASDILSQVAMEAGHDAKKSEVHGMAQRGGVVSSHVRFGERVWSPIIPEGGADVLLAFEQAEALRAMHLVAPGGSAVVNTQRIIPPIAAGKDWDYPENPLAEVRARIPATVAVSAREECRALGNEKMVSVLLLGALSASLDFDEDLWRKVIRARVPRGTEDLNWRAFQRGRELASA
ncbi:MAG: indolepyruvate oxidoreductase subunit beta [Candidatus Krumholzibacteriota bacterium]|nr:indolepyruvate oxidoreductase subunit beta [Candidatus Krumholzibacteriota bacterium]